MTIKPTSINILLVEDNPGDAELAREGFENANINVEIQVAEDGAEAIRLLKLAQNSGIWPLPDIILLDLNLPKMNGKEFLSEIKSDKVLCLIPVVVLTSSAAANDIRESYQLHANSFIQKPEQAQGYIKLANDIKKYWFETVHLAANTTPNR